MRPVCKMNEGLRSKKIWKSHRKDQERLQSNARHLVMKKPVSSPAQRTGLGLPLGKLCCYTCLGTRSESVVPSMQIRQPPVDSEAATCTGEIQNTRFFSLDACGTLRLLKRQECRVASHWCSDLPWLVFRNTILFITEKVNLQTIRCHYKGQNISFPSRSS